MLGLKEITSTLVLSGVAAASYAPNFVACPSDGSSSLRLTGTPQQANQTINPAELSYTTSRKALAASAFKSYLANLGNGTVFGGNVDAITAESVASIGIAVSGGGDRAALFGAGVIAALDGRNASSVAAKTGGFLQSATYLSALSGGSWMLTSLIFNQFPASTYDLVLGNNVTGVAGWNLVQDLFSPGNATTEMQDYYPEIYADLAAKKAAGPFNVTFGDYWARTLSYHFLPGTNAANIFSNTSTDHGASITLSSATSLPAWQNFSMPFPIILGDIFTPNNKTPPITGEIASLSSVIYEITPLEFGSYDPQLATFLPMKYLGTAMNAGTPTFTSANGSCVNNFDDAGFMTGISSNLFSYYNESANVVWANPLSPVYIAWTTINSTFYALQPNQQLDISAVPNPFKGINAAGYQDSAEDQLRMVDGGLDGQVDPIAPLIVKGRGIEMILVADATADSVTQNPTGDSMVATYERSLLLPNGTTTLPPLPNSTSTYLGQGLSMRPTFFGCKGTAATLKGVNTTSPYPMIVFLPNYSPLGITNTSTGTLVYSEPAASTFLDTAVGITTRGFPSANGTADAQWGVCLACAAVERMRGRMGVDQTADCTACFTKYCWNELNTASNQTSTTGGAGSGGGTTTSMSGTPSATAKSGAMGKTVGTSGLMGLAMIMAIGLVL